MLDKTWQPSTSCVLHMSSWRKATRLRLLLSNVSKTALLWQWHDMGWTERDPHCYCQASRAITKRLQVVWLDVTASKSRYGTWLGASLPEFVPFPKTGRARGGAKQQRAAAASAKADAATGGGGGLWEDDDKFVVRLRRLR